MCWFHGEHGVGDVYRGRELGTDEVIRFLREVAPSRPSIYFGGAEPLMRTDFPEIAGLAAGLGMAVGFTTNALLLAPEISRRLLEGGLDRVNFSVDGPPDVHDRLRGEGTFARAMENIRAFLEVRGRGSARPVRATVNVTVNPLVAGRLVETVAALRDATGDRIDEYRVHHLWFVEPERLRAHERAVEAALGCSAAGAAAHLLPHSYHIDVSELSRETDILRGQPKVVFFPRLHGRALAAFYSAEQPARARCTAPWRSVLVKPDGAVRFCPDEWIDGFELGTVRESKLADLWTSADAGRFRRALAAAGTFPACKRCSWLR